LHARWAGFDERKKRSAVANAGDTRRHDTLDATEDSSGQRSSGRYGGGGRRFNLLP
jgi:hypothetical protein